MFTGLQTAAGTIRATALIESAIHPRQLRHRNDLEGSFLNRHQGMGKMEPQSQLQPASVMLGAVEAECQHYSLADFMKQPNTASSSVWSPYSSGIGSSHSSASTLSPPASDMSESREALLEINGHAGHSRHVYQPFQHAPPSYLGSIEHHGRVAGIPSTSPSSIISPTSVFPTLPVAGGQAGIPNRANQSPTKAALDTSVSRQESE